MTVPDEGGDCGTEATLIELTADTQYRQSAEQANTIFFFHALHHRVSPSTRVATLNTGCRPDKLR